MIIKHTTPCGVALAASADGAYERAFAGDPVSAFGGIVAFNGPVSAAAAQAMSSAFLEIVVAPAFEPAALEVLTRKKNLRLIQLPVAAAGAGELDYKRVRGGFLAQARMRMEFGEADWREHYGPEWEFFSTAKRAYDPDGILNPGFLPLTPRAPARKS